MKLPSIKFEWFNQWGQIYVIPTIRVTHTLKLYGWYTIEFVWLGKGLSLNIFV